MREMAVIAILSKRREVAPTRLDRPVGLEIGDKQEKEPLDVPREPRQYPRKLLLDPDLVSHVGYNITRR